MDDVAVGAPVAAIGSPFGEEQSLSTGVVSATDRSIESLTEFQIDGAIQTDASINPGNSGGPLLDADGRVIGLNQQINTTSGGNEGVGYAVPIDLALPLARAAARRRRGRLRLHRRDDAGLYPQLADRLDIDVDTGALIAEVTQRRARRRGRHRGLRPDDRLPGPEIEAGGDVIVAVNG